MKKYIAPDAKIVALNFEGEVMQMLAHSVVSHDEGLSNQRQPSASSTIWGFDDEAE